MWTENFQTFKLDFEKPEEPENKLSTFLGSRKKAREFQKNICFGFVDYANALEPVYHNKLCKILRDGDTRLPYPSPEKFVCRSRNET